jgi:hypothetical protein
MHYQMHRKAAEARVRTQSPSSSSSPHNDKDLAKALWEPQAPYRNPMLPGREGNTNVWFNPHKGGLVYDDSWLRRRVDEEEKEE